MDKKKSVKSVVVLLVSITMVTAIPGFYTAARAGGGAAFLGGMLAGHLVSGAVSRSKARTQAEEYQAYSQPRTTQTQQAAAPAAQPAPAPKPTAEQRLQQLDKLAAGGYITPAEYKTKRKAILDSM